MILYFKKRIRDGGWSDWKTFPRFLTPSCPRWHVQADHGLPAAAAAAVFIILYIIDVTTRDFISCLSALFALNYHFKLFGETLTTALKISTYLKVTLCKWSFRCSKRTSRADPRD